MKGLLILVCFNQELEIERVLRKVKEHHPIADAVVVDDGSSDRSAAIARDLGFTVLAHERNRGVGASIRTGIEEARKRGSYEFVIVMACNGKMDPADIPIVAGPILEDHADYVQGSRYLEPGRSVELTRFRRVAIPLFTAFTSALLVKSFTDVTCGFRAYRLSILEHPKVRLDQPWLDRYELEYYVHYWACRLGFRVVEAPVTMDYSHLRQDRKSKIQPLSGWWSMIRPIVFLTLRIKR
jgi:dolichol-phosphate mannosyltransferase